MPDACVTPMPVTPMPAFMGPEHARTHIPNDEIGTNMDTHKLDWLVHKCSAVLIKIIINGKRANWDTSL